MNMLTVSSLICAIIALTRAAGETDLNTNSTHCPSGWIADIGRCFLYVPKLMTWANAEKNCQSEGGNLASLHSFCEYHVIQSLLLRLTKSYRLTWVGGFDAQQEGIWFWSDGTPFDLPIGSPIYWSSGMPDNHLNGDCLAMNFGGEHKLDDQYCGNQRPSVCSKKQTGTIG
ncbi:Ladderlectin Precursor [Channa argus]|uniref:Ladderlectin n=1 Tax=Channa argus TaxID=215402 RepID=A0A6G1Q4W7_CHAAH|nr:Ladderlectin Precursor [Channa argus]